MTVEVWPDNAEAFKLWQRIGRQWRFTMAGPYALDYGPLFHELDRLSLTTEEYDERFEAIQVIEAAYLEAQAEARELAKRK